MRPCERRGRVGVAISSSPGRGDGRDERDLRPSGMLLSMPSLEREEREKDNWDCHYTECCMHSPVSTKANTTTPT